jgi:lambda family phage portal protein
MEPNWLDRAISYVAPRAGLMRVRARAAAEILVRHYEGAASGRRTQGWKRPSGDANAAMQGTLARLRETARDLVRNNGHAESAITTICDHVVGWGIVAKAKPKNARAAKLWEEWAGTTACDAEGQNDFAGLQHLVMRTVVESGEALVRRRFRRPEDGLPIPMQIQVLEPDYLDTDKTVAQLPNGGRIVYGIEFDPLGRRAAYWLFEEHPGSVMRTGLAASRRIPAESVLHVYRKDRASQVRGASWFAPIMLKFHDYDDYDDATLMKQKIAACLAVITSDVDGTAPALGTASGDGGLVDELEPGMVLNVPPGRTVSTVQPPTVREYADYSRVTLRTIASGLGVSYEDLTGDYTATNFSSARMARLRHWARVENWRWVTLVPGFCSPVWMWAMEVAGIFGVSRAPRVSWTPPPMPMIEPDREGLAYMRNVRAGIMTLSEAIRERGYDPEEVLAEMAADNKKIDQLELVLDSDPRKTSQAGLTQARPAGTVIPPAGEPADEPPPTPAMPASPDATDDADQADNDGDDDE